MNEDLKKLKKEFIRIKNMGYVEASRSGTTGIGKTFEDLLGKKDDRLGSPDYNGIEIKTKRSYSRAYITLFNAIPNGNNEYEIKRLRNNFGYPDKILKNEKVLNVSVQGNCSTLVADRYLFKLEINYDESKIYLVIYDKYMNFIEKESFWEFNILKDKLEIKFKYLALIKAWPQNINNKEYYKYYDIEFYKLKSFEDFLYLIEDGTIRVTFKIGVFRKGTRIGDIHDRGTGFEIQEIDLYKLFDNLIV